MDYISDMESQMPPLQSNQTVKICFASLKPKTFINVVTAFDAFFLVLFMALDTLFLLVDAPQPKKNSMTTRLMQKGSPGRLGEQLDSVIGNNTMTHFVMLMSIMLGNLSVIIYTMWFRFKQSTSVNHGKKKLFFYLRGIWGILIIILGLCIIFYDQFGAGGNQWEWGVTLAEIIWGVWVLVTSNKLVTAWITMVRKDLEYYYD